MLIYARMNKQDMTALALQTRASKPYVHCCTGHDNCSHAEKRLDSFVVQYKGRHEPYSGTTSNLSQLTCTKTVRVSGMIAVTHFGILTVFVQVRLSKLRFMPKMTDCNYCKVGNNWTLLYKYWAILTRMHARGSWRAYFWRLHRGGKVTVGGRGRGGTGLMGERPCDHHNPAECPGIWMFACLVITPACCFASSKSTTSVITCLESKTL